MKKILYLINCFYKYISNKIPGKRIILFIVLFVFLASVFNVNSEIFYFGGSPIQYNEVKSAFAVSEIKSAEIMFMWNDIESIEGVFDFSKIDLLIEQWQKNGRKVTLRPSSAHHSSIDSPRWLFEKYGVRRINRGPWLTFDNNNNLDMYEIKGEVGVEKNLNSTKSLTQEASIQDKILFSTIPGKVKSPYVMGTGEWSIQFDYYTENGCTIKGVSKSEGKDEDTKTFILKSGQKGTLSINLKSGDFKNEFAILINDGSISVDNINMVEISSGWYGTTVIPNYFDETFKNKWEQFISSVSDKYGDDKRVENIVVGGFGRWEEITLEDDVYETLLDQFPVYGFTNPKYLDHLAWCVNLYKKYFPQKNLIMCAFGHGTVKHMDRELVNLRSGQFAASKGVALKYNGHSDKSYDYNNILFNRYESNYVKKYFETYHQISRERNVGNPVSVISRAIVNNADSLYLYGYDSNDSKIWPSMKYANEALGGTLLTGYFAKFGAFPFNGEVKATSVIHNNISIGIRQKDKKNQSEPEYGILEGEPYIKTTDGSPLLRFDVDGSSVANGMSGATFTIKYYDEGTDQFRIKSPRYDTLDYDENLKTILTIKKTDTKKWVERSVSLLEPMLSYEGDMSDNARDFILDDKSDGTEKISFVDLQFIPLNKYKTIQIGQTDLNDTFELIARDQKKTVYIQNDPEKPISEIQIPLGYTDFYKISDAFIEIYGKDEKGFHLIRNYLYYALEQNIPLKLSIPWSDSYSEYKITVSAKRDAIKWFKSDDGKAAVIPRTYETAPMDFVKGKSVKIAIKDGIKTGECEIKINKNFAGIYIPYIEGVNLIKYRIDKKLPDGNIQKDVMSKTVSVKNNQVRSYFSPLTPGIYTVYIEVPGSAEMFLTNRQLPFIPVEIIPGVVPKKAYKSVYGKEIFTFDIRKLNPKSASLTKSDDTVIIRPNGLSPSLSIDFNKTAISSSHSFNIKISNQTSCNLIKIILSSKGQSSKKSLGYYMPIVSNDNIQREYSIFFNSESGAVIYDRIEIEFLGGLLGGQISILNAQLRDGKISKTVLNELSEQKNMAITDNYEKITDFSSAEKRIAQNTGTFKLAIVLIIIITGILVILVVILKKRKLKNLVHINN